MFAIMERTRMIFDADDLTRRAVKIYAAKHDLSISDAINAAIRELCADEFREAERIIAGEDAKAKGRKKTGD